MKTNRTERPIIFSTLMVQAILEGRKIMTRRIVKIPDVQANPDRFRYAGNSNEIEIPLMCSIKSILFIILLWIVV
jgi:hypothetical protein